jgi:hypothetical protein
MTTHQHKIWDISFFQNPVKHIWNYNNPAGLHSIQAIFCSILAVCMSSIHCKQINYLILYTCPRHHTRKLHALFCDGEKTYTLKVHSQREIFCHAMVCYYPIFVIWTKLYIWLILDTGVKVLVVLFLQCTRQKNQEGRDRYSI